MNELTLTDIWRKNNPNTKAFTWRNNSSENSIQCRLDFFLISKHISYRVSNTGITHGYKTDHSMITLTVKPNSQKRGKG